MNTATKCKSLGFTPVAAIFDVDDTLLDNRNTSGEVGQGLHERSRLAAVREIGKRWGLQVLAEFDAERNYTAFTTASVHTLDGAVWNILCMAGLADGQTVNEQDPLLQEIVALKNKLHEKILREEAEPLSGAVDFVEKLGVLVDGNLAIASTAIRRDIDIFLQKTGLDAYFLDGRIISKEKMTHPKPHPQAFELAFQSLDLPEATRRRVLAFEDDPRGIMSAKAAGLYACAIAGRFSREELERLDVAPDCVAESYAEFARFFGFSLVKTRG